MNTMNTREQVIAVAADLEQMADGRIGRLRTPIALRGIAARLRAAVDAIISQIRNDEVGDIYQLLGPTLQESTVMARTSKICLSMIVKNEAHIVEQCLRSVRPYIDSWAVVDTGSTDGTQDLIRSVLSDLPGELIERPWVDFAHNRNQALELARGYGSHALFIDADDKLEGVLRCLPDLKEDAYSVEFVHGDYRFWRTIIVNLNKSWRWHGVVHEALVFPPDVGPTIQLMGLQVIERRLGSRNHMPPEEKYRADAALLRRGLVEEPDNTRYQFYLAQSLRDAGDLAESETEYVKRVNMGGWDQEVFYSLLQVAMLKERQQAPEGHVVAAYLNAYQYRPTRAEPVCELARFYREREQYVLARMFAREATMITQTDDILFVDAAVYDWKARDELATASYWCGDLETSKRMCQELLNSPGLPAEQRSRIQINLAYVLDSEDQNVVSSCDEIAKNDELRAKVEELEKALRLARPYVVGAYECAFPDAEENQAVLAAIDAEMAKAGGV